MAKQKKARKKPADDDQQQDDQTTRIDLPFDEALDKLLKAKPQRDEESGDDSVD